MAVGYEVADEFVAAFNCHCSNCRAMTGSVFLPWGEIDRDKLRVTKGADALLVIGDSAASHEVRCQACLSLVYWSPSNGEQVRVPYGSLIDEPALKPTAHIFVGSKAKWYEILDDLPRYDERPELNSLASMLSPGDPAPEFQLPDQDGDPFRLSELRGQTVVLYFYPKADTPGCTTQACGVRDHRGDYEALGATVLGISPDPVSAVKRFHARHGLSFLLLADEDHSVCDAYGVWVQKSMYGRTYMGAERSTFLVDPGGRVQEVLRRVRPAEHDELVLAALGAAGG